MYYDEPINAIWAISVKSLLTWKGIMVFQFKTRPSVIFIRLKMYEGCIGWRDEAGWNKISIGWNWTASIFTNLWGCIWISIIQGQGIPAKNWIVLLQIALNGNKKIKTYSLAVSKLTKTISMNCPMGSWINQVQSAPLR